MGTQSRRGTHLTLSLRYSPQTKKRIQKLWISYLGAIFFLLFLVSLSVRSILLSYQIQNLQEQIRSESEKKADLEQQQNQLMDLRHVEEIARKELGFIPSQNKNIIIITITQ